MAENVRIYLRIRPSRSEETNSRSNNSNNSSHCLMVDPQVPKQAVTLFNGSKAEVFTYDCVGGPETEQEEIFESVAKPVTEYCLQGYNGTIFAYGQTGSGKTFTMQGPMTEANLIDYNQRGLIPRTFEYLFECIRAEEEAAAVDGSGREFLCKCSYVEIYNETIFDLLDISGNAGTCSLREDIKRGVYIEGAKEEIINSPSEAYEVYERGSLNRHVAETSMNRESSRSHSVFTLFIQSKQRVGEIMDVRESRFNLVDLAGSERQQMTGTTGQRLKEAGNINKSLLALSNVINGLVDISNGRARHVQYRDSKLTFLLRDSLGGNAKTVIIANVSPSSMYYNETLSTLKFAQRAKMIKNKAVVNKDIQGNVLQLQAEIQRLQHELYLARHSMDLVTSDDSIMKKPRLVQSTNEDELDPAEAYLMLTMALERQAESSDEIESLKTKVHLLEELVKRKESQNQSIRMILKFRENSLKSHNQSSKSKESESEEVSDLKEEINELRKIIEHHPEVTRFAYENLQLREKLYKYEANEKKFEEFDMIIGRHKQYEQLLTNRILVLEKADADSIKEEEQQQEGDSCNNIICKCGHSSDNTDVKMQNFNVNLEEKDELIVRLEKNLKESEEKYKETLENYKNIERKYEEILNDNDKKYKELLADTEEQYKKTILDTEEKYKKTILDTEEQYKQIILDNENVIKDLRSQLDDKDHIIDRLNNDIMMLNNEVIRLKTVIERLNNEVIGLKDENEKLSNVIEGERQSISSLMQEKGELLIKVEQFEKQKEQTKLLISNYEKVKNEFNEKISELNLEILKGREEVENLIKKLKTVQSEKIFLQQELEVTRQILAEYKSKEKDQNISTVAAEKAGKRISELEIEILKLNEKISQQEVQNQNLNLLTDRNKILQAENGQLHGKIGKLEFLMRSAQSDNDELMGQVAQLQKHLESSLTSNSNSNPNSNENNTDKIISLQNQLEAANHTISSMKRQLSSLESDLSDLRSENDKLTQHQNLKQKLQYHLKIKQENNELQEELTKCRDELMQIKTKQDTLINVLSDIKVAATAVNGVKNVDKILQLIKTLSL